jgi:2-polyprenyl-6-methoxyphenol hydroxylase-like FAD-dependent oxidoreductase
MEQTKKFKAIIVGGSVSGLTLALCFEKANVDYIILEAREQFAPQVGASVGLFPNGLRIMDQLGIAETIEQSIEPLMKGYLRSSDGKCFCRTKIFEQLVTR